MKDNVYSQNLSNITDFTFSKQVAQVFNDMAERSIPYYHQVSYMTAQLAQYFYQENTKIYDLGSSTGILAKNLSEVFQNNPFHYIGIDNSAAMVEKALELNPSTDTAKIKFFEDDILSVDLDQASVVVANYTIQFIRPVYRPGLIRRIFESLAPGGALIISEKVLENHSENSRLFNRLYFELKKQNGYSQLEIAQKREALENVLIPYRLEENIELLHSAGFHQVDIFFKWYNFTSILATKKS